MTPKEEYELVRKISSTKLLLWGEAEYIMDNRGLIVYRINSGNHFMEELGREFHEDRYHESLSEDSYLRPTEPGVYCFEALYNVIEGKGDNPTEIELVHIEFGEKIKVELPEETEQEPLPF